MLAGALPDLYSNAVISLLNHVILMLPIHMMFQVLFSNEKIGIGIGKTRDEAQVLAAEKALQNLESEYNPLHLDYCKLEKLRLFYNSVFTGVILFLKHSLMRNSMCLKSCYLADLQAITCHSWLLLLEFLIKM